MLMGVGRLQAAEPLNPKQSLMSAGDRLETGDVGQAVGQDVRSSRSEGSRELGAWWLGFLFWRRARRGLQAVAVAGAGHALTSFSLPALGTASSNGSPGPASSPSLASPDLELGTQRPESMHRCM